MEEQLRQLNERLTRLEQQLGGLSNDPRQIEVIKEAVGDNLPKLQVTKFIVGAGTPVARQSHISNPSGGITVDSEARTAIANLTSLVETFGLTDTS